MENKGFPKTGKRFQGSAILLLLLPIFVSLTLSTSPFFSSEQNTLTLSESTMESSPIKVTLQAIQNTSHTSFGPISHLLTPLENNPPNPPLIDGPTTGEIWIIYLFNITVTDPDEDPLVLLEVDFGDGSDVFQECGCNGPWPSGKTLTVEHQWKKKGTFTLKARVQDGHGLWSDWGTLDISLPKFVYKQPGYMLTITRCLLAYFLPQTIKF
jgi:hypothetical protein